MAKPNYQYEKRQRELEKKKKKEEKAMKRTTGDKPDAPESSAQADAEAPGASDAPAGESPAA